MSNSDKDETPGEDVIRIVFLPTVDDTQDCPDCAALLAQYGRREDTAPDSMRAVLAAVVFGILALAIIAAILIGLAT